MGAFHAYDIRGIYNVDFDKTTAYKVGYFLPGLLNVREVLVGRGLPALSSREIHDYLIEGINRCRCRRVRPRPEHDSDGIFRHCELRFQGIPYRLRHRTTRRNTNGMKVSMENALPVGSSDNGLGKNQGVDRRRTPLHTLRRRKARSARKTYAATTLGFLMKYREDYSGLKIAFDLSNGMSCPVRQGEFSAMPHAALDCSAHSEECEGSAGTRQENRGRHRRNL